MMAVGIRRKLNRFNISLAILFAVLLSVMGWLIYQRTNRSASPPYTATANEPKEEQDLSQQARNLVSSLKDDTDKWLLFTSERGTFSFRIPDGWQITHQTDSDIVYATGDELTHKAGTPATVTKTKGGRDGVFGFVIAYDDESEGYQRDFTSYKKIGEFKTDSGLEGTKYSQEITEEPMALGPPKGTKQYVYFFTKDGKGIYAQYDQLPGAPDELNIAEKAIGTLVLR